MGNYDVSSADKLINTVKAIIKDELNNRDATILCKVSSINTDGTYNVCVEPDEDNIIHNIPALSNAQTYYIGQPVWVYKIRNQLNNAFILKAM